MSTTKKKNTTKLPRFNTPSLRKILRVVRSEPLADREYPVQDRVSEVPIIFANSRVCIYNGRVWKKKTLSS